MLPGNENYPFMERGDDTAQQVLLQSWRKSSDDCSKLRSKCHSGLVCPVWGFQAQQVLLRAELSTMLAAAKSAASCASPGINFYPSGGFRLLALHSVR